MPGKISRELSQNAKWNAVQTRDRAADGTFVYAVRSTGIYCRPSCVSRKPLRKHVVFFPCAEVAGQQGFRPCRRCNPRSAAIRDPRTAAVARVCLEIDKRIAAEGLSEAENKLTLGALGRAVNMSSHQLGRAFRSVLRISPRQYADALKMSRLKARLKRGDTVTTALYDAGFNSSSRLYERAPGHLGMTPDTYRKGGAGMHIDYTIVPSPLGRLLVGATNIGISALYLGESNAALEAALRKEYPKAEIRADAVVSRNSKNSIRPLGSSSGAGLNRWVKKVLAHLRGSEPRLDLPTDVQASAFQRRVWEELRRIPFGATRTYTQVAQAIGRPTAVRAVARACATNPVSVVVPCHRVVREDGNLGGYRWGLNRKKALLKHETALASSKK